jgi:EAL domain-containing protein (putative c-di-GMP-specific phosphodiesterase class I)
MQNADIACQKVKEQGGNDYRFFTPDMNAKASAFISMERNLVNAMRNDEYVLHYQPYFDIRSRKMVGMEALIRWQSSDDGLVNPGSFIPVLEKTGMIIEVGEWVVRTAIRQLKEWQRQGYPAVPVSVNLSPVQFRQKNLVELVKSLLSEFQISPSLLVLEITEGAFIEDIKFTKVVLEKLKKIGVSISIDDFGTGYSSLSYLKRFPVDNLKIDISFVREIATDSDTASIVSAIITMANALNLKTIAEGIETEEQLRILHALNCNTGQGFYFSKPLCVGSLEKRLIRQGRDH